MNTSFERDAVSRSTLLKGAAAVYNLPPLSRMLADTLSQDDFALFMAIAQPLCDKQVPDAELGRVLGTDRAGLH